MRNVILLEIVVDKIIVMILIQKKCTMNYSCKNPLLNVITIILIWNPSTTYMEEADRFEGKIYVNCSKRNFNHISGSRNSYVCDELFSTSGGIVQACWKNG